MAEKNADPSAIRSLAVSPADVVDAYVYTQENPGQAVLRVTPPFHGRMRARLHVYRVDDAPLTGAVHLDPAEILEEAVVADYPEYTADGDPKRARKGHAEALERWQEDARGAIVDSISLQTGSETREVTVKTLG